MSFQDKLSALMARPGQDPVAKDDVPWWLKFAGRGVGTLAGFLAIFLGVWVCTGIIVAQVNSLVAGMWQIIAGFILLCIEAPCCCMFIDHVQRLSDFIESKPYYMRAIGYFILAIPPLLIRFSMGIFFGSGLIFATGILYGMMALGRKATAEEMRQAAAAQDSSRPTNMRSNLVANAQPISLTGAPVFDSNV
ncbi:calcium channel flower isoform X1 [Cylas formicarius]|uniref:calcium channel flower isoform X1 n=1 Tax=Cylas formicarius TaxID=197179 RepID=UPI002958A2C6|nr:calcium channel flower isoform X1 [Cylas formicarius]